MNVITRLRELRAREHECTVEIIRQLIVCHETRAWLEYGCSTLFSFLVEELKYSPAAASRRYKAMRVALRYPEVLEMLTRHELTLCSLAQAESLLAEADDPAALLDRIRGKSSREVEKVVAGARPVPRKPRESVKPVAVRPAESPLFAAPDKPAEARISVRTTLTEVDYDEFERVRAIVSRKKPGASVEDVLVELTRFYLKHKAPRERRVPTRETKQVPKATRDAVMIRDAHRCTFVGRNGKRCTATRDLQIDHIEPRALGGTHEPENLRVLCGAHNRHEARRILGTYVRESAARWSVGVPASRSAEVPAPRSTEVPAPRSAEVPASRSSSAGTVHARPELPTLRTSDVGTRPDPAPKLVRTQTTAPKPRITNQNGPPTPGSG